MKGNFFNKVLVPNAKNEEDRRRGYILNVILAGCISLAVFVLGITVTQRVVSGSEYHGLPPLAALLILAFFYGLLFLSKKGYVRLSANIVVHFFVLINAYMIVAWGPDLPQAILICALTIVLAGIVLGGKADLITTSVFSMFIIAVSYLQASGAYHYDSSWKNSSMKISDAILMVATLFVIASISWLWNRQTRTALEKIRESEMALKKEKAMLELRVEERTRELRKAQAEKMHYLLRFAKFGQLASGVLHDLINPLTAVSLNLRQIQDEGLSEDIKKHLELAADANKKTQDYLSLVRKQLKYAELQEEFEVCQEIQDAIKILKYPLQKADIEIRKECGGRSFVYGNPLSFHKAIVNLISNAIEAYEGLTSKEKVIVVRHEIKGRTLKVSVQDYGKGIPPKQISKIFDPFFSTKDSSDNLGLGLSLAKESIEEMGGSIKVKSQLGKGTTFEIFLPVLAKALSNRA